MSLTTSRLANVACIAMNPAQLYELSKKPNRKLGKQVCSAPTQFFTTVSAHKFHNSNSIFNALNFDMCSIYCSLSLLYSSIKAKRLVYHLYNHQSWQNQEISEEIILLKLFYELKKIYQSNVELQSMTCRNIFIYTSENIKLLSSRIHPSPPLDNSKPFHIRRHNLKHQGL